MCFFPSEPSHPYVYLTLSPSIAIPVFPFVVCDAIERYSVVSQLISKPICSYAQSI